MKAVLIMLAVLLSSCSTTPKCLHGTVVYWSNWTERTYCDDRPTFANR